jgi:hypothetical protein
MPVSWDFPFAQVKVRDAVFATDPMFEPQELANPSFIHRDLEIKTRPKKNRLRHRKMGETDRRLCEGFFEEHEADGSSRPPE